MLLLPRLHPRFLDQITPSVGRRIEEIDAIDHAGFTDELPGLHLVGMAEPEAPGIGPPRTRRGDRVRRHIQLRAGVAVEHQDVAVVGAARADAFVVIDLKGRKCRPRTRVFRRHQQRTIDELGRLLRLGGAGGGSLDRPRQHDEHDKDDAEESDASTHDHVLHVAVIKSLLQN